MMPDNPQPTQPLPESIEEAIYAIERDARGLDVGFFDDDLSDLRQAITTALAQAREDSALRERAERLRRFVRAQLGLEDDGARSVEAAYEALEADDLADDLQPAQEAETSSARLGVTESL